MWTREGRDPEASQASSTPTALAILSLSARIKRERWKVDSGKAYRVLARRTIDLHIANVILPCLGEPGRREITRLASFTEAFATSASTKEALATPGYSGRPTQQRCELGLCPDTRFSCQLCVDSGDVELRKCRGCEVQKGAWKEVGLVMAEFGDGGGWGAVLCGSQLDECGLRAHRICCRYDAPGPRDNRSQFKRRAEYASRGVRRAAFVDRQIRAEPVLAGREEITEFFSVACCADEHLDLQFLTGAEIDSAAGTGDGRGSVPAHNLTGLVYKHRRKRLAGLKRADAMRAHVANDEIRLAAVSSLKDATLGLQAKLQTLDFHNLRIRSSPSTWPRSLTSHRIAEGADFEFDGIPVAFCEFLGEVFLVGLQSDAHDADPDAEARHHRATGLGFASVEGAVHLTRHVIELRLGPTNLLKRQPIGVGQQPAKLKFVSFEISDKTRDKADPGFVLKTHAGPALRVRFAVTTDGIDIAA